MDRDWMYMSLSNLMMCMIMMMVSYMMKKE
jgi:hypothetical protein